MRRLSFMLIALLVYSTSSFAFSDKFKEGGTVFYQDDSYETIYLNSFYFHPLRTLISAGTEGFSWYNLTYERNFPDYGSSLILSPTYLDVQQTRVLGIDSLSTKYYYLNVGYRKYLISNNGFYGQISVVGGIMEILGFNNSSTASINSGFSRIMGYGGYKYAKTRFTLFADFGVGAEVIANKMETNSLEEFKEMDRENVYFVSDFHFGVGFRF